MAVVAAFFLVLVGGGSTVGLWKELEVPAMSEAAKKGLKTVSAKAGKAGGKKATAKERRAQARKERRAAKIR